MGKNEADQAAAGSMSAHVLSAAFATLGLEEGTSAEAAHQRYLELTLKKSGGSESEDVDLGKLSDAYQDILASESMNGTGADSITPSSSPSKEKQEFGDDDDEDIPEFEDESQQVHNMYDYSSDPDEDDDYGDYDGEEDEDEEAQPSDFEAAIFAAVYRAYLENDPSAFRTQLEEMGLPGSIVESMLGDVVARIEAVTSAANEADDEVSASRPMPLTCMQSRLQNYLFD
jgi:hypothetical protein